MIDEMLKLRSITRDEAEAIYLMNIDTTEGQYIRDMFEEMAPLFRSYLSVYDSKTVHYVFFAHIFELLEGVAKTHMRA